MQDRRPDERPETAREEPIGGTEDALPPDAFFTPDDVDALRMENELLSFEVRFLRARLGLAGKGTGANVSMNRLSHLEEAENDLVLLVRRLSTSPLGPLLRRSGNFRTLEERYLQKKDARNASIEERVAYLEGAENDLVLLLRRMGRPPLGALFRRKREFRTLEERYL